MQSLRSTLIRYLASLGYSKDSVGISKLNSKDITLIEGGVSNHLMKNKWALYPRVYELFWEIENYIATGDPSGHSLSLRYELAKNGINTAKRFFWFGTGTGDANDEIMQQYELDETVLNNNWRFRPHNQYLTFFVAFGFFGFALIVVLFSIGIIKEKNNLDFISLAFLLIALISMLSEDTLETQAGVTFFAFFLSLLFLGRNLKKTSEP